MLRRCHRIVIDTSESSDSLGPASQPIRRARWWPAVLIFIAAAGVYAFVWLRSTGTRQDRVLLSVAVGLATTLAFVVWALLFSRFSARLRRRLFVGLTVASVLAVSLVRVEGFSGDMLPILTWVWDVERDRGLDVEGRVAAGGPASPNRDLRSADAEVPPDGGSPPGDAAFAPRIIGPHDFPQFLGQRRTGFVAGIRLDSDWDTHPPVVEWENEVGAGWASFAIAGMEAFTLEQRGDEELVVCYELNTGDVRWSHPDPVRYSSVVAGDGPRSTPTVTATRVFVVGATGRLRCLDRGTGHSIWSVDVIESNGARLPEWGLSCSPLVHRGLVIVGAGGPDASLVAYDAATGAFAWGGGSDRAGYASPFVARLAGIEQIIWFGHSSVTAHSPDDGRVMWSHPWSKAHPNVAQPMVVPGDRLLVSSGYGVGCELLEVTRTKDGDFGVSTVWKNRNLKAKFSNFVVHGDSVYGIDDGILVCLDLATGERRWKGGRYGHGQMLLVEDRLLLVSERGELVLIDSSPERLVELAKIPVLGARTWQGPALSRSLLLMRNHERAVCLRIPLLGE